MKKTPIPILAALCLLAPFPAACTTYLVTPDGMGDFPTIQRAIAASVDGDVIELADGTFRGPGNRDLDYGGRAITIRSRSGNPEACVLDCAGNEGDPHRGFLFSSGEQSESVLAGITITNGWMTSAPEGGAVLCMTGSSPQIQGCLFSSNRNAAVGCIEGSSPILSDCVFSQNHGQEGGAVSCDTSSPVLDRCTFLDNTAELSAGAFYGHATSSVFTGCVFSGNAGGETGAVSIICGDAPEFHDCLFRSNSGYQVGGLLLFCFAVGRLDGCTFAGNFGTLSGAILSGKMSDVSVSGSTFWGNSASSGSTIHGGESTFRLDHSIVSFSTDGSAIACEGAVTLICCDLYGNAGGDWTGCIEGQYGLDGNISEDPLFCDPLAGDLTIRSDSPCAPAHDPNCGLIGAWPVGCEAPTPVVETTWGRLRVSFR